MKHVGTVALGLVVVLNPLRIFRQDFRIGLLGKSPETESVAAIVGDVRITNDLIGGRGVLAAYQVFQIPAPGPAEGVDDLVANRLVIDIVFRMETGERADSRP